MQNPGPVARPRYYLFGKGRAAQKAGGPELKRKKEPLRQPPGGKTCRPRGESWFRRRRETILVSELAQWTHRQGRRHTRPNRAGCAIKDDTRCRANDLPPTRAGNTGRGGGETETSPSGSPATGDSASHPKSTAKASRRWRGPVRRRIWGRARPENRRGLIRPLRRSSSTRVKTRPDHKTSPKNPPPGRESTGSNGAQISGRDSHGDQNGARNQARNWRTTLADRRP